MGHPQLTRRADRDPKRLHLAIYSDATETAGAEISVANLLGALDAAIDVTVVGVDRDVVAWIASARPGAAQEVVPAISNKRDVRGVLAHRRLIARLRPDVFQVGLTSLWAGQYPLLAASTVRGVATVAVEHLPLATAATAARRRLKRVVSRRLAAHVAVGERAARAVESLAGLAAGSVRVIPNGVPDPQVEARPRVSAGPVIGTLARLDPIKGLDVLLHALAGLPGVAAAIVGRGPSESALRALAADLGVDDRVHFIGWSDEPRAWLAGFDVFVLPSRLEGMPLSVIEAMLAGRPVVATDVGSVSEVVVDGETGILVPPDDAAALRDALQRLLADDGGRQAMGELGLSHARHKFTAGAMARAYEALYREISPRGRSALP